MPSALRYFLLGLTALAALSACEKKRRWDCPRYEPATRVVARPRATPPDPAVADVNGRAIPASELRHRMAETGLAPRAALAQLIDEELLVQEAERRGLHREAAVVDQGKQAAIYKLLRETFEPAHDRRSIPEARLRKIYRANLRTRFDRPQLRRYAHLFVFRPWTRRGRGWHLDQAEDARIKGLMQTLRQTIAAAKPADWKAFSAYATKPLEGSLKLQIARGTAARDELRPALGAALWALERPGDLTEVVSTKKWHHIAFLVQIIPHRHVPYAQAREEILNKVWPIKRRNAFAKWLAQLKTRCPIRIYPEHLPVDPIGEESIAPDRAPPGREP